MFGTNEWPHLVGRSAEEAKSEILQNDPSIKVVIVPQGSPVTRDYRIDRVRVFIDHQQKVISPPRRG